MYASGDDRPSANSIMEIHYLRQQWDESSVSWKTAKSGTNWSKSGGYFSTLAVASVELDPDASGKWHEFDVTKTINDFLSGSRDNFGFIVKAKNGEVDIVQFESSESSDQQKRPKLVLTVESSSINRRVNALISSQFTLSRIDGSYVINTPAANVKTVELIGVNGRVVASQVSREQVIYFDTHRVPAGLYLLNVYRSGKIAFQQKVALTE